MTLCAGDMIICKENSRFLQKLIEYIHQHSKLAAYNDSLQKSFIFLYNKSE
jgi:hypothetical protein